MQVYVSVYNTISEVGIVNVTQVYLLLQLVSDHLWFRNNCREYPNDSMRLKKNLLWMTDYLILWSNHCIRDSCRCDWCMGLTKPWYLVKTTTTTEADNYCFYCSWNVDWRFLFTTNRQCKILYCYSDIREFWWCYRQYQFMSARQIDHRLYSNAVKCSYIDGGLPWKGFAEFEQTPASAEFAFNSKTFRWKRAFQGFDDDFVMEPPSRTTTSSYGRPRPLTDVCYWYALPEWSCPSFMSASGNKLSNFLSAN